MCSPIVKVETRPITQKHMYPSVSYPCLLVQITATTGICLLQNNAVVCKYMVKQTFLYFVCAKQKTKQCVWNLIPAARTKRHCKWYINNRHVVFQGNCSNRGRSSVSTSFHHSEITQTVFFFWNKNYSNCNVAEFCFDR